MNTSQNTMTWAGPYIQYSPTNAGLGGEPATSICSMIRNTLLNAPLTWSWNRAEKTFTTTAGQQDYPVTFPNFDFGFLEKVAVTDINNAIYELKDVYNTSALSVSAVQARPNAICLLGGYSGNGSGSGDIFTFRFMSVPNAVYTVTLTYQKQAPSFGPFTVSSVAAAAAGNTTYTGSFSPQSFPVGSKATFVNMTNTANNGTFLVVSVNATTIVVANAAGVLEATSPGSGLNLSWSPIPDQYSDIYNNLFLSEALAVTDDARAQTYRQRGVAAFLAKSEGLSETQKNAFVQQWLARGQESAGLTLRVQQGGQGRSI